MKSKILFVVIFLSGFCSLTFSQNDIQIGSSTNANRQYGAFYDYSDPVNVNIKVQLWGYVRYPGYYIIPANSSVNELISFAGGPTEDALLEDIRVTKIKQGEKAVIFKYNYNDLMWENDIKTQITFVPLEAGDVVVVPGEPRYFGRENFQFFFSIFSSLATIAVLIYSVVK